MKSSEVREKYLKYFESKGHKRIEPAPLVLENDDTTLFTSSGVQPLVPYLMGQKHPKGKRLVNSQPSIRTQDIEEVGDNRHTTFFEMLGNWSLGDYFKKEQLPWIYEFLTKELNLPEYKLWFSVFEGDKEFGVPEDTESVAIWKSLGVSEKRIVPYGVKKNWWSRTGTPKEMPVGDIGGPTSEIFYDFGEARKIHEASEFKNEKCHPNCDCGRFIEIGNNVFMEYKKVSETELEPLPHKNIDFGGGFERIVAATDDDPDVFNIDIFEGLISQIEEFTKTKYGVSKEADRSYRIIADHLRAAVFLLADGVVPSNKLQGYIARRLVRRAVYQLKVLGFDLGLGAVSTFIRPLKKQYKKIEDNWYKIKDPLNMEAVRFGKALERGIRKFEKAKKEGKIDGKLVFDLYQSEGFPLELAIELLEKEGKKLSAGERESFQKEFEKHQDKSRSTSKGMFKGGLADHSDEVVRLHTTAHLLHAALRQVLGESVLQKGQNITAERLRFDVSYNQKLTGDELKKIEKIINDRIEMGLKVNQKMMSKAEAEKTGAIGLFTDKYSDEVSVYFIGDSLDTAFSKEFCGGPHVGNTKEIGRVRIKKQEKIGSNLLRIYMALAEAKNGL